MASWNCWVNETEEAWSDPGTLPAGSDITRKEFIQQFYDAFLERAYLAPDYYSSGTLGLARADASEEYESGWVLEAMDGDLRHVSFWIANLQSAIEAISYTYLHRGYWTGTGVMAAWGPPVYNLSNIYIGGMYDFLPYAISGGAGYGSWRRSLDGENITAVGRCQVGDVIGPWIFEDLRKAITALRDVIVPIRATTLFSRMESPVPAMTHLAGIGDRLSFTSSVDQWLNNGVDVGSPYLVNHRTLNAEGAGSDNARYSNIAGRIIQTDAPKDEDGIPNSTTVSQNGGVSIQNYTPQGVFVAGWAVTRYDSMQSFVLSGGPYNVNWSSVHYTSPEQEGVAALGYWLYVHPNFNYL